MSLCLQTYNIYLYNHTIHYIDKLHIAHIYTQTHIHSKLYLGYILSFALCQVLYPSTKLYPFNCKVSYNLLSTLIPYNYTKWPFNYWTVFCVHDEIIELDVIREPLIQLATYLICWDCNLINSSIRMVHFKLLAFEIIPG